MIRTSVVYNPELMRQASIDLRHGIPGDLFYGADEGTRAWLRDEHARQRAGYLRERAAADSERHNAAQRLLSPTASRAYETAADQMRRLQALLLEVAAVAGRLANAIPITEHDQPGSEAGAPPSQEMPS